MARLPERTGFGKEVMFLPVFRFDKAFGIGWDLKAFLNLHAGVTRGAVPDLDRDLDRYKEQAKKLRIARQKDRQLIREQRTKIKEQTKALYSRWSLLLAALVSAQGTVDVVETDDPCLETVVFTVV